MILSSTAARPSCPRRSKRALATITLSRAPGAVPAPLALPPPVITAPVHRAPVHRAPVHRAPVHRAPVHRAPVDAVPGDGARAGPEQRARGDPGIGALHGGAVHRGIDVEVARS